ncbi:MAG: DciA family protein [Rhodomicrobium sp.]
MAISHDLSNSAAAVPPRPGAGPVAVGRFIVPIAGKTLSRGGTVMAGLLSQWAAIAGPTLAASTMPAKLTSAAQEPAFAGKNAPAMLHLKVDPAKALELQYAVPQLVERINQALGYKAVAGIRLIQAPVQSRAKKACPKAAAPAKTDPASSRLSNALARMAAGVKERSSAG